MAGNGGSGSTAHMHTKAAWVFSRWVVLVAGIVLMAISGTIYLFGVYSDDLKHEFGYTQTEVNSVSTIMNSGLWASFLGGFFYDRFGPRSTTFIGALFVALGYLLMHLEGVGALESRSSVSLGLYAFLVGQGGGWLYTAALNTSTINFEPKHRGKVVGLLVSFFGLSAGIFALVYGAWFQPDTSKLFLFFSITIGSLAVIASLFNNISVGRPRETSAEVSKRLKVAYIMALLLALYIGGSGLLDQALHSELTKRWISVCIVLFFVAFIIVGCSGRTKWVWRNPEAGAKPDMHSALIAPPSPSDDDADDDTTVGDMGKQESTTANIKRELNLLRSIRTSEYWLLFAIFAIYVGSGVTVISNLGNMVKSLKGSPQLKDDLGTLLAVFNSAGRMFFGFVSDRYSHKYTRAHFLIATGAILAATQALLAFSTADMLYAGIILTGFGYGGVFCLLPCLVSELFGVENFGGNYSVMGLGPAAGSLLFSTYLAGHLYERHADVPFVNKDHVHGFNCVGGDCYRASMLINASACVGGMFLSFLLIRRIRTLNASNATALV